MKAPVGEEPALGVLLRHCSSLTTPPAARLRLMKPRGQALRTSFLSEISRLQEGLFPLEKSSREKVPNHLCCKSSRLMLSRLSPSHEIQMSMHTIFSELILPTGKWLCWGKLSWQVCLRLQKGFSNTWLLFEGVLTRGQEKAITVYLKITAGWGSCWMIHLQSFPIPIMLNAASKKSRLKPHNGSLFLVYQLYLIILMKFILLHSPFYMAVDIY